MTVGARNIYGCDKCLKCIVTVDKADGTTPFMIGCEATKGCTGEMYSSFYKGSLDDEPRTSGTNRKASNAPRSRRTNWTMWSAGGYC